ncbi:hypothetical protein RRG08_022953 [Elysia crispata]|uniref:ShKT domain-containing protein n=1 Tax=Elysia crispata TaxID=231223 RepID=A0AAE1DXV3_9GAST|nr:hypothetical protein RRG08_022953 [Elysia crispata]
MAIQRLQSRQQEQFTSNKRDYYHYNEDTMVRSLAKGIIQLGAAVGIQGWDARLRAVFKSARSQITGISKYLGFYFSDGVQSYFNATQPDTVNHITTKDALKDKDPDLYNLIEEIFPCGNTYLKRCETSRAQEDAQQLRMNCEPKGRKDPIQDGKFRCTDSRPECEFWHGEGKCRSNPGYLNFVCEKSCGICDADINCFNDHKDCSQWALRGECSRNPDYMLVNCKMSCGEC